MDAWIQVIVAALGAGATVAAAFIAFLGARFKDLKIEAEAVRAEFKSEAAALRREIGKDFTELKTEFTIMRQQLVEALRENSQQATAIEANQRDLNRLERRIDNLERSRAGRS